MKNYCNWGFLLSLIVCFCSCQTAKQLTYFRDLSDTASLQQISSAKTPALQIQPDDQIQVSISSPSPDASTFFNLMLSNPNVQATGAAGTNGTQALINVYTVSAAGVITLPVLGDIQALGLTLDQLKQKLTEALKPYLATAIVSTKIVNFKVTVIGEVVKPQTVPVNGEHINVLEAIGASGDMTMYGARQKVKVIRKLPDGSTEIARLDFNSSRTFQSPYFNLRQNDVVYIQPNKNKSFLANNTTFWASLFLSVASIVTVFVTRN